MRALCVLLPVLLLGCGDSIPARDRADGSVDITSPEEASQVDAELEIAKTDLLRTLTGVWDLVEERVDLEYSTGGEESKVTAAEDIEALMEDEDPQTGEAWVTYFPKRLAISLQGVVDLNSGAHGGALSIRRAGGEPERFEVLIPAGGDEPMVLGVPSVREDGTLVFVEDYEFESADPAGNAARIRGRETLLYRPGD